jgi:hypothetical protein
MKKQIYKIKTWIGPLIAAPVIKSFAGIEWTSQMAGLLIICVTITEAV